MREDERLVNFSTALDWSWIRNFATFLSSLLLKFTVLKVTFRSERVMKRKIHNPIIASVYFLSLPFFSPTFSSKILITFLSGLHPEGIIRFPSLSIFPFLLPSPNKLLLLLQLFYPFLKSFVLFFVNFRWKKKRNKRKRGKRKKEREKKERGKNQGKLSLEKSSI